MPRLFEPLRLRQLTVKNRVWLSPMCQYSVTAQDGVPTDWHLVHLGARAQGGFGLLLSEATAVTAAGRISPQDTGLWNDAQRDAWAPIVDFVHGQDAAIGVQLAHAGRKASTYRGFPGEPVGSVPLSDGGWETLAPSALAFGDHAPPTEMTQVDIAATVQAFADAARRADQAGFDVVEIHAAHGYLLHQFLSPVSNRRTDGYGGDFAGRTRILREAAQTIRGVWPAHKPLFARLSATDWVDDGWDLEQSAELARLLAEDGVDLVDVSSGGSVPAAKIPVAPGYQVPFSDTIRRSAQVATAAVGLVLTPQQAEDILEREEADAIFLGRPALREPAWPLRAAAELGLTWREAPYPLPHTRGAWDGRAA